MQMWGCQRKAGHLEVREAGGESLGDLRSALRNYGRNLHSIGKDTAQV